MPKPNALDALEHKLWRHVFLLTTWLFLFFALYNLIVFSGFSIRWFSQTLIGTSGILFCLSLGLSSLNFYFPTTFGHKVIYRRYLGLMGYFVSLIDLGLLLTLEHEYYVFGLVENAFTPDLMLGGTAMVIFTLMALISNDEAIAVLGPKHWRSILRLGYLALLLLVMRAFVIEGIGWNQWLLDPQGLPPVRLVISLIALTVLFARLSLVFHNWWYRKEELLLAPTALSTSVLAHAGSMPSRETQ